MKGHILIHPYFNKDNPFYVCYKVTLILCMLFLSIVYVYIMFVFG